VCIISSIGEEGCCKELEGSGKTKRLEASLLSVFRVFEGGVGRVGTFFERYCNHLPWGGGGRGPWPEGKESIK